MDEFSLINSYFKSIVHDSLVHNRDDVIFGIGDDAACLQVPVGMQLLVSCDTLVSDVHFLSSWDAYDVACRAVMVNVSDIAAMGGSPCWMTLALTLPAVDESWLQQFSQGLRDSLSRYSIALIGGDTTRGPLSMTMTIHGLVPEGLAVRRNGAAPGDIIYVSGELGAAALAVAYLERAPSPSPRGEGDIEKGRYLEGQSMDEVDKSVVMRKLLHPEPRIDLSSYLQSFATAAIDISDGLGADLYHICSESHVGACLDLDSIPVHSLVKKYQGTSALDFALSGGDDYELCFTVASKNEAQLVQSLAIAGLRCYPIGVIEAQSGVRVKTLNGESVPLEPRGYSHF